MKPEAGGRNEKIRRILDSCHKKLDQILQHQAPIGTFYRQTCADLMPIIRSVSLGFLDYQFQLEPCIRKIAGLVECTQIQKYGHKFPLFSRIIYKYEAACNRKIGISKKQLSSLKLQLAENSDQHIRHSSLLPISERDLNFLQSSGISNFFAEVTKNDHVLQDPNCVGCSPVFIKDHLLINTNPAITKILPLINQNDLETISLARHINALCNEGGGILLIGAESMNGVLSISGIKYKKYQQVIQKEKQLNSIFKNLTPPCSYAIQRIFVHTNYSENKNVADQYLRICFRLRIAPKRKQEISYLQFSAKGYQNAYQIYQLDKQNHPEILPRSPILYKKIHSQYYKKFPEKNQHQNISCLRSYPNYSKMFTTQYSQGILTPQLLQKMNDNDNEKIEAQDDINFVYQHTSLLAVVSKKNDRYIQDFLNFLGNNKEEVALSKPFEKLFKNCSRSIWMLSHKKTTTQISQALMICANLKIIPADTVYVIPVQKMLQIERQKLSQFQQKALEKRFYERYNQAYKTEKAIVIEKNKEKQIVYMVFNDFAQAIYCYLMFEELQLRPFFVKESSLHKNKTKKTKNLNF